MYITNLPILNTLQAISDTGGFPGPLSSFLRARIVGKYAEVEVSPHAGLDLQWTLTPEGKKYLRWHRKNERYRKNAREREAQGKGRQYHPPQREAPVPLSIEVLDALKAIRERGDPETDKLDILARIQRYGIHGAVNATGVPVHGSLATFENGIWSLTEAGRRAEAGHIRKSDCAQFSGKVR